MLNEPLTGLSAGGSPARTGLWANYDHTRASDATIGVDTRLNNFVIGGDHKVMDKLGVGASVSYQHSDSSAANADGDAWTVAPYLAYIINNNMGIDAVAGYTWMNTDYAPGRDFDTHRYFFASNLNAYTTNLDKWEIGGHVGFMFVKDDVDAYAAIPGNDISFLQAKTGIEAAYKITNTVQPYLNLDYEDDLVYEAIPAAYDSAGFVGGIGVRFDLPSSVTGDLHYGKTYGRGNFDQDSFMANLRMNF
ncbi:MAG: autotransporter outer membrane beta-barrel domain-containing protein [Magnetococcales bacterium]|nr:autotransporter outer membrane beta-barrel domain-containing protein [Magnetococcales bacterium]